MQTAINILLLAAGLTLLKFGADYLVGGAVGVARRFRISELLIGLTIVSAGTSAPELITSVAAALRHEPGIVLGNAMGSNIANLTLILGAGSIMQRIPVSGDLLFVQKPALVVLTLLSAVLLLDGSLSRADGVVLLLSIVAFTVWLARRPQAPGLELADESAEKPRTLLFDILLLFGGLAALAFGADLLVRGATGLAELLQLGGTVIGATVVALGTSAPELAATIASARRKRHAILLGNLVGSCQFNLAAILGIPAIITPIAADRSIFLLHLPALALATLWGWLIFYTHDRTVRRREGVVCVLMYAAYVVCTLLFK